MLRQGTSQAKETRWFREIIGLELVQKNIRIIRIMESTKDCVDPFLVGGGERRPEGSNLLLIDGIHPVPSVEEFVLFGLNVLFGVDHKVFGEIVA